MVNIRKWILLMFPKRRNNERNYNFMVEEFYFSQFLNHRKSRRLKVFFIVPINFTGLAANIAPLQTIRE